MSKFNVSLRLVRHLLYRLKFYLMVIKKCPMILFRNAFSHFSYVWSRGNERRMNVANFTKAKDFR